MRIGQSLQKNFKNSNKIPKAIFFIRCEKKKKNIVAAGRSPPARDRQTLIKRQMDYNLLCVPILANSNSAQYFVAVSLYSRYGGRDSSWKKNGYVADFGCISPSAFRNFNWHVNFFKVRDSRGQRRFPFPEISGIICLAKLSKRNHFNQYNIFNELLLKCIFYVRFAWAVEREWKYIGRFVFFFFFF